MFLKNFFAAADSSPKTKPPSVNHSGGGYSFVIAMPDVPFRCFLSSTLNLPQARAVVKRGAACYTPMLRLPSCRIITEGCGYGGWYTRIAGSGCGLDNGWNRLRALHLRSPAQEVAGVIHSCLPANRISHLIMAKRSPRRLVTPSGVFVW